MSSDGTEGSSINYIIKVQYTLQVKNRENKHK